MLRKELMLLVLIISTATAEAARAESLDVSTGPVLYAVDIRKDVLLTMQTDDADATTIGALGVDTMINITFANDRLLGFERDLGLHEINPDSGAATQLGDMPFGFETGGALGFDPTNGKLYATLGAAGGIGQNTLVVLDPDSGAELETIGELPFDGDGMAIHPVTGQMYILEVGASGPQGTQLWRIDKSNAMASNIGSTGIERPQGMAFHPLTQDLYIVEGGTVATASQSLYIIDPVDLSTQDVGTPGFLGISGMAFKPRPSLGLLVSSHESDSVLMYDGNSGDYFDSFVPAGRGGLDGPTGLIFGPDGNLYVSSMNSDSVLRYDGQTGAFIDAFVPPSAGGLDEPQGLAFGPDGHLYVSSFATDSVLRYNGESGCFIDEFVSSNAGLEDPFGLLFGPNANLYVVSNLGSVGIHQYDGQTGAFIDVFANEELLSPYGIVFGPDGNLYVSIVVFDSVRRYDGQTGDLIDTFVDVQEGGLNIPYGLVFRADGDLFVSSNHTASVLRYDSQAQQVHEFVPTGSGGLLRPTFLIFDNDWDMDSVANDVDNCRFIQNPIQTDDDSDGFGNPCDRCPGFDDHQDSNSNSVPDGCDLDCNSNSVPDDLDLAAATSADCNVNTIPDECETPEAFVASRGTGEIFTFNQFNGEFLGVFADVATLGVSDPGGISLSLIGNLFVASNDGSLVLELDRMSGELVRTFGTGGELDRPRGVAFTAGGSVLIASRDTHQIEEFDMASGNHLGVFASGGGLEGPFGLAMGPNGNLFVASANTDQILEYDGADGSFIGVFADQGLDSPFGISFGPDGNLFVASWSADQIVEFAGPTSESPGVLLNSFGPACGLSQPTWLAFRDDGRILASNSAESHVMLFGSDGTCFDGQFLGGNGLDLPRGVAVYPSPAVKGDHDQDCLVTLADYAQFEICSAIGGPDTPVVFQDCDVVFDFDYDKDIDLQDFAIFATNVDLQQQRP